jgi:hypothetical protein
LLWPSYCLHHCCYDLAVGCYTCWWSLKVVEDTCVGV